jgi:glycosyltransferase involved in cell wall biosynthesis
MIMTRHTPKIIDATMPLVTIGVLSYNRAQKIGRTIDSILNQNYNNVEILISDDASTDGAVDLCRKYAEKDPRVTFFEHEHNIGPYRNYEFLINQAHGKYFMWISDDDEIKPNIINRYVEFLENNPDYGLVSGKIQYWRNGNLTFVEEGLCQEGESRLLRVLGYYSKVKEGAMFYGLIRTRHVKNLQFVKNKLAGDWHVVAHIAYKAKVKQLDFVSMNKNSGGFSSNWKRYAQIVGAGKSSGIFPIFMIGLNTMRDICSNSRVYGGEKKQDRIIIGILACLIIWVKYYVFAYPRILGGKIKRFLSAPKARPALSFTKNSRR